MNVDYMAGVMAGILGTCLAFGLGTGKINTNPAYGLLIPVAIAFGILTIICMFAYEERTKRNG